MPKTKENTKKTEGIATKKVEEKKKASKTTTGKKTTASAKKVEEKKKASKTATGKKTTVAAKKVEEKMKASKTTTGKKTTASAKKVEEKKKVSKAAANKNINVVKESNTTKKSQSKTAAKKNTAKSTTKKNEIRKPEKKETSKIKKEKTKAVDKKEKVNITAKSEQAKLNRIKKIQELKRWRITGIIIGTVTLIIATIGVLYALDKNANIFNGNFAKITAAQVKTGDVETEKTKKVAIKTAIREFKKLGEKDVTEEKIEILKIRRGEIYYYYIQTEHNSLEIRISDNKVTRINSKEVNQ